LFLSVELFKPKIIFLELMLDDGHAERTDLEVGDDGVEL